MTPSPNPWAWAQQLPALAMILGFLWMAGKHGGKALMEMLRELQAACHKTTDEGHVVMREATGVIGRSLESDRMTRDLLVEVKTLLIKKNGGG